LGENFDKIENTLLRFTVAMSAALNPEMYREEYLKKLYKLLTPEGQKDEYGDMIQEFSKYMASLQGSGSEASGKLSKETQQAIKAFRTAASKELKQKNLANKLKKGDTAGQKYWWNVSWGNGRVEVVATTKEEAIDKAFNESYWAPDEPDTPQAIQFRGSLRAKPLSPYYEKSKPSVWKVYGSNSSPYQRLGVEVVATDEFEAMQKARQKWNLNVGGRTEEEFFSTNGWSAERIGEAPVEQPTKYEIYNKQTGNSVELADGITNDADALVRLNDYIEHGPHALQRGQASRMFGIRTTSGVEIVDIDIPMAQGRAQTSPTGQWKIIDGLGREVYRFRPAVNTRAKANELAAVWAREYNWDGNYQVEPAEDSSTGLTSDQQQGGLIDIAPGSTTDLAQQRATPGTFTGAWRVLDADGNELHRFSGVGNVQSDANRVAVQWMQNNGHDYGTDISVVPIMSESIAESLNEFAPGGQDGGDSGRWYTDDELADIIGDDWFEDFDVSHDEFNIDTHGEKAKQNLASYANSWFDDKGYNVNVLGVDHNDVDHDLKWYIVGSFYNPRFANEGMAEASIADMRNYFAGDEKDQGSTQVNNPRNWVQKRFRSPAEYSNWLKQNKITGMPLPVSAVSEEQEFYSMPLRMSEYRGKHHPATEEPYDSKFKFSGDLKDRVHSLLDAGTKPKLLQVNPRHLLATQDWLSNQGGGKPPFATMKQHPVVLQKNNKLYILDGHHRSADALNSGAHIEVYLFQDEL
jgi:hypothetical protein